VQAAEENARSLISDAEVLLGAGRWPRAYSLAVLAHEEFGKALMAMALFMAPDVVRRQPRWIKELRSGHARKLISGYQHQAMVGPGDFIARTRESPDLARTSNEGKQRGLYADLADESVRPPSDVTEADARAEVESVRQMVHSPGLRSMPFWLPFGPEPDMQHLRHRHVGCQQRPTEREGVGEPAG
jgi:AbiV family abortive infection protein